jgi:hypothetical protein
VEPQTWHGFEVDGETFYWSTQTCQLRHGEGRSESGELLTVARKPEPPGVVGVVLPPWAVITEQDAVELVRRFKVQGETVP